MEITLFFRSHLGTRFMILNGTNSNAISWILVKVFSTINPAILFAFCFWEQSSMATAPPTMKNKRKKKALRQFNTDGRV
jgi:hypothetical protein